MEKILHIYWIKGWLVAVVLPALLAVLFLFAVLPAQGQAGCDVSANYPADGSSDAEREPRFSWIYPDFGSCGIGVIDGYTLQLYEEDGSTLVGSCSWDFIPPSTNTSYTISSFDDGCFQNSPPELQLNTSYKWKLNYKYRLNQGVGNPSTHVHAGPAFTFTTTPFTAAPDPPTGFQGNLSGNTSILWSWDNPAPAYNNEYIKLNENEGPPRRICPPVGINEPACSFYSKDYPACNYTVTAKVQSCNSRYGCSDFSLDDTVSTLACVPGTCSGNIVGADIVWAWGSGSNSSGTEFFATSTNQTTGSSAGSSGWVPDMYTWTQSGWDCETTYQLSVKARNSDGIETAFTQCSLYTGACQRPDLIPIDVSASVGQLCLNDFLDLSAFTKDLMSKTILKKHITLCKEM